MKMELMQFKIPKFSIGRGMAGKDVEVLFGKRRTKTYGNIC